MSRRALLLFLSIFPSIAYADGVVSTGELAGFLAFFLAYVLAPLGLVLLVLAWVTRGRRWAVAAVVTNTLNVVDALLILNADRHALFIAYAAASACSLVVCVWLTSTRRSS